MKLLVAIQSDEFLSQLVNAKRVIPILLLTLFWAWESWKPFFRWRKRGKGRLHHAARNLALTIFNAIILSIAFGTVTVLVADWTQRNALGLLNRVHLGDQFKLVLAVALLDGWMFLWHWANHAFPFLWRFHRMHHSDLRMDVTTATRFHVGEHVGSATLRLGLIPLIGFQAWHIVFYELMVIGITQLHHANISLGPLDRWLRVVIVTPDMHKVHHSNWRLETNSNYSTVFSVWDRLARTFRMRTDLKTLEYGLSEFDDPRWQTIWGMFKTPFVQRPANSYSEVLEHE